jgi:hypothetical protein
VDIPAAGTIAESIFEEGVAEEGVTGVTGVQELQNRESSGWLDGSGSFVISANVTDFITFQYEVIQSRHILQLL